MEAVRTLSPRRESELAEGVPTEGAELLGALMLDIVYLLITIALFVAVGLLAKGVERL